MEEDKQTTDDAEQTGPAAGPLIIVRPPRAFTEARTLKNSTPTSSGDKMEGQCQTAGCMSTREPNGERYTCPRCVKEGK